MSDPTHPDQTRPDEARRPTATRLDLLQLPGCSARLPYLSHALPILTFDKVSGAVMGALMRLMTRVQRDRIWAEHEIWHAPHARSIYDLRTRMLVMSCDACGVVDVLPIAGELDASWGTIGATVDLAHQALDSSALFWKAHHGCARIAPDPGVASRQLADEIPSAFALKWVDVESPSSTDSTESEEIPRPHDLGSSPDGDLAEPPPPSSIDSDSEGSP